MKSGQFVLTEAFVRWIKIKSYNCLLRERTVSYIF